MPRLLYLASLAALAAMVVAAALLVGRAQTGAPSTAQAQLLRGKDGVWVLQYEIAPPRAAGGDPIADGELPREGTQQRYVIAVDVDGALTRQEVLVGPGARMTYTQRIRPEQLTAGNVTLRLLRDGDPEQVIDEAFYRLAGGT